MSSLTSVHALQLDPGQQQAFIQYLKSLPEKPPTIVRIFDRHEYYTVHGEDATTAAGEIFNSVANIKQMGVDPDKLDYLVLSKGNFEILIKKLLLIRRYKVEVYEAAGSVKGVKWELKYKGSPGCLSQMEDILSEGQDLSADQTVSLMAVLISSNNKDRLIGVACVTAAEYVFSTIEFYDDDLMTKLETIAVHYAPTECLIPMTGRDYDLVKKIMGRAGIAVTAVKRNEFDPSGLMQDLNRLLKFKGDQQRDANVFPETRCPLAVECLAAAIKYVGLANDNNNFGRFKLSTIQTDCFLHIDAAAMAALNVLPAPGDTSNSPTRSLYGVLDRCRTKQGKRLLLQWLRQPIRDIKLINERLDIVACFVAKSQLRLQLHDDLLKRIPDFQALAQRLTKGKATLQDCHKIYQGAKRLPALLQCLSEANNSIVHACIVEPISELNKDLAKFKTMIEASINMEAAGRGESLVSTSFNDHFQDLSDRMAALKSCAEQELKRAALCLSLAAGKGVKLDFNAQIGFFYRVTLKEEHNLRGNDKFTIIDAVKGGVRFKNIELDDITKEYMSLTNFYQLAQDKIVAEILSVAAGYADCIFSVSLMVARLDVLVGFAVAAAAAPIPYTRPTIMESCNELILRDLRHPCIELQDGLSFIPNDVFFKRGSSLMHIVTGANMGGKSTWMRSCGVAVLLAHVGSFVPAQHAAIPALRTICARVGASDREEKGQSTFMLEMIETAAILRTVTPDSLVLVDELGRGTSSYEGCGIAWAIAEELAMKSQCFTLFATHFHELTRLESFHPNVIVNSHAEAAVVEGKLVLVHKIVPGPATQSLGLLVAQLAGLPDHILEYAHDQQEDLEVNQFNLQSSAETAEALVIISEFIHECKEIRQTAADDVEFMVKIYRIKQELMAYAKNRYIQAFLA